MVIEENRRRIMLKKVHVMGQEMEPMVVVIVVIFEDLILVMAVMDLVVKLVMVVMDIEDLLVVMDIEDLLVDMENDYKVLVATVNQLSRDLLMINQ
jgi:hypothetical protein